MQLITQIPKLSLITAAQTNLQKLKKNMQTSNKRINKHLNQNLLHISSIRSKKNKQCTAPALSAQIDHLRIGTAGPTSSDWYQSDSVSLHRMLNKID